MSEDTITREKRRLRAEVEARLRRIPDLPAEVKDQLVQHADEFLEVVENTRVHGYSGSLNWRWAIRNEHLDLVALVGPVAVGLATHTAAVDGASSAGLAVTLILAVLAVARKLDSKATELKTEEFKVLVALKQSGPCKVEEVVAELNGLQLAGSGMWTSARVEEILRSLTTVRLRDGSVDAFTVETPDGIWSANGV